MKFLLRENLGQATMHRIGDCLRRHGTGHHWFERYRGRIFVIVADAGDEGLLRTRFLDVLEGGCDLDSQACGPAKCPDIDPRSDRDISRDLRARRRMVTGHENCGGLSTCLCLLDGSSGMIMHLE